MTRSDDALPHAHCRVGDLPIDPDLDERENVRHDAGVVAAEPRSWRPRLHADVLAVIFAGGCVGGWARYAITSAGAGGRHGFPWATFGVNVAGAFILALVIVIAADVRPSRYLRPLLGTGFCGAFTTFSAVVVASDQLFAHGHAATAVAYLAATTVCALAAATAGFGAGRVLAAVVGRGGR